MRQRLSELHLPPGGSMRAPGEAVGLLALECAMDELAEKLDLDPIELRVINDISYDPAKGRTALFEPPAGGLPAARRRGIRLGSA
ncbi:molybdopterin cofactor-binding domain-containing protein [Deinococcus radiophilus]|uniref:molybdopterin cofactor-binding domain-containing protein n=1 Tax=Deinococcus radiophilus TaxID=32062 RepID=UPI0036203035